LLSSLLGYRNSHSALENIITSQSRVSSNKQREEEEQEGEEAKKER
jgi:hypothetical protein